MARAMLARLEKLVLEESNSNPQTGSGQRLQHAKSTCEQRKTVGIMRHYSFIVYSSAFIRAFQHHCSGLVMSTLLLYTMSRVV